MDDLSSSSSSSSAFVVRLLHAEHKRIPGFKSRPEKFIGAFQESHTKNQ